MAVSEKAPVRFQRANFVVADLDRALTFYEGVLGFEIEYRLGDNPESYSRPIFEIPEGAKLGFVTLNLPNQRRIMALTEIGSVAMKSVAYPRRSAIVLETHDPDAVMAGASDLGLTVYKEEVLKTADGRIGREIGIVDFDDNLIVIYNFPESAG
ncbi:VOC family protein [uncultured Erythrobacter sp.]|uniref:VOC family protein n=1 Tax=uncultured Erythrobacter sp. TaxID=263913 RepID=UPI0026065465|nr:VOC family protein [uncultured Erythrobacter sp.]